MIIGGIDDVVLRQIWHVHLVVLHHGLFDLFLLLLDLGNVYFDILPSEVFYKFEVGLRQ